MRVAGGGAADDDVHEERNRTRSSVRDDKASVEPKSVPLSVRSFRSAELFAGEQEVIIEHGDEHYRLRSTRNGKLILTK